MTNTTVANRITEHELGGYTYYTVEPTEYALTHEDLSEVVEVTPVNEQDTAIDGYVDEYIQRYYGHALQEVA